MPYDVAMCPGGECPLRASCYRYRALPAGRQDWLVPFPYDAPARTGRRPAPSSTTPSPRSSARDDAEAVLRVRDLTPRCRAPPLHEWRWGSVDMQVGVS